MNESDLSIAKKFKMLNIHIKGQNNIPELNFHADFESDRKISKNAFFHTENDFL